MHPDYFNAHYEEGIILISEPRSFDGGEEEYDVSIGGAHDPSILKCGRGAYQLASFIAKRRVSDILEIGAGGGTCSLGLIEAGDEANLLITDTSPAFLRMIKRKVDSARLNRPNISYGILAGEDLDRLPAAGFDAIIIASALHHVDDWCSFIVEARRVLRPGGVLVIQEPCREGNLMMGMALDVVLSPLWTARLCPDDIARLKRCRDSIYFLADSTIEKHGEDKHCFLVTELAEAGVAAGFAASTFYSNFHFADLDGADLSNHSAPCSLITYLDSFLEQHHKISKDGLRILREHLYPFLSGVDGLFRKGVGAPIMGSMVFLA